MLTLEAFAEQYDQDIVVSINDGVSMTPEAWREYFNVNTTSNYTENTQQYSGFGVVGRWQEGENLPMDEPLKLGSNTLTQAQYGMGFSVSRTHARYGQVRLVMGWAGSLGRSLGNTYGIVHGDVLNNAFTTTYTSLGGVALVSASHTASGSATRSNINASAALTPANLNVLVVQGANHVNYRGLRDPILFRKLIIPPALDKIANEILGSAKASGTTDNDMNYFQGKMRIIVEPFADDSTTHYFVQADTHGMESLHGLLPETIEYFTPGNQSRIYGIAADFTVGVENWEGVAGSQGA